jgi:hypothetical protein
MAHCLRTNMPSSSPIQHSSLPTQKDFRPLPNRYVQAVPPDDSGLHNLDPECIITDILRQPSRHTVLSEQ